jgi:hypothetical protein
LYGVFQRYLSSGISSPNIFLPNISQKWFLPLENYSDTLPTWLSQRFETDARFHWLHNKIHALRDKLQQLDRSAHSQMARVR